jgi:hypothetical protein
MLDAANSTAQSRVDGSNYLVAGEGKQTSMVKMWASTPADMSVPPLRCDRSVDLVRARQWGSWILSVPSSTGLPGKQASEGVSQPGTATLVSPAAG